MQAKQKDLIKDFLHSLSPTRRPILAALWCQSAIHIQDRTGQDPQNIGLTVQSKSAFIHCLLKSMQARRNVGVLGFFHKYPHILCPR